VMGHEMLFALRDDGTLVQHGLILGEFPDEPYIDVATSGVGACVVREDGFVRCIPELAMPEVLQVPYRKVALEHNGYACAIRRDDGGIDCWGPESSPFYPPEGSFTQIAATWGGMCAVRTDGTTACFNMTVGFRVPQGW